MTKIIEWDGNPISKAGIYRNVNISVYHSGKLCVAPSISSSGLRTIFLSSEAHFWDTSPLNPDRAPRKEAKHFILGRAAHHLLTGEAFFTRDFVVQPDRAPDGSGPWNGNKKVCKKWLAEAAAIGKTVLTEEMVEDVRRMAISLGKEPLVRAGALNGEIECTMAWPDEETGVWLLARPDVIPTDSGDYVDIKTTRSARYEDLVHSIGEYGYQQQGALVMEGHEILFGRRATSFSLYFVESSRPHCAKMVELKDRALTLGREQNRNALRRFVRAMNNGVWPGPGGNQDAVLPIDLSERMQVVIRKQLDREGTDVGR